MWKRGEIAPKEQFLLFSTIFSVYLYFQESNYIFICEIWLFDLSFFLNYAILICRDTDILKYFRESVGLRDNESQLYWNWRNKKYEPQCEKMYFVTCAPNADSNHKLVRPNKKGSSNVPSECPDQSVHPSSLIIAFTVSLQKHKKLMFWWIEWPD